jgi:N-methylhydantoinase B
MTAVAGERPVKHVDPVTLRVIVSRLSGIVQEMQQNIFRTGYSTIVRESHDASCMLMDASGEVVGEHAILPLHVGCMPSVTKAIINAFGADIHPGDAFITNHPYVSGVPHAMDMAVITPVFHDARLIGFAGSIAHKSDLGGVIPGTGYAQARELFQEGIQYPPVRLVARDVMQSDIEGILRANSRTPDLIMGDIRGQIGVARLGERRIAETIAKYGIETLLDVYADVHRLSEERLRAALRMWPDGVHEAETFVDTDGIDLDRRVRYHVRVEKTGDRIHFDFSGCDDQVAGPINIQPALARSTLYYIIVGFVDQTLPNNAGVARVVETTFRPGSVVAAHYPAPHNTYMASTIAITDMVLQALSGFVPEKRHAGNGGVGGNSIAGKRDDGSTFVQYELVGSAYGGRAFGDGTSAIDVLLSNGRTAPIEILESEYPTRVERFELIRDSGGPGKFRGGISPRRIYRMLAKDAQWTLRGGRHEVPASGADGGKNGRVGAAIRQGVDGEVKRLPSRFSAVRLTTGDVAVLEKAGGGGFGDPHERPFERVLGDVLDGYVSRESAIADYGVDPARLDAELARWNGSTGT